MNKQLQTHYVLLDSLRPSEYNPRFWDQKTIHELTKSIKENGFVIPILANSAKNREGIVIAGHFRLKIAKDLGLTTVPVNYVDISEIEKEKKLNLTLNRVSGDWDYELLKNFDIEMLLESGFDNFDLTQIFDENLGVDDDEFKVDEELSKIKTPKTRLGDLIILGNHRLICADSQDSAAIKRLVGESNIHMLNFDPIYNIDLDYNNGFGKKGKYGGKVKGKKLSGEIEIDESYFGGVKKGKRGRGAAGKSVVLGILERNGLVYTKIVYSLTAENLLGIIREKTRKGSVFSTDTFKSYTSLKQFGKHRTVNHGKALVEKSTHNHINGIEGFWSYSKHKLYNYHGVSKANFGLCLKEMEYRFNHRNENILEPIMKLYFGYVSY